MKIRDVILSKALEVKPFNKGDRAIIEIDIDHLIFALRAEVEKAINRVDTVTPDGGYIKLQIKSNLAKLFENAPEKKGLSQ